MHSKHCLIIITILFVLAFQIKAQQATHKLDFTQASITHLDVNASSLDFGPVYYNSNQKEIVYASARRILSIITREDREHKTPYVDLYRSEIDPVTGKLGKSEKLFSDKISKYHVGPATFSKTGLEIYYTINKNEDKKQKKETLPLQIIYSKNVDGEWSEGELLSFNDSGYSVAHPTLSHDGKTLYFTSDMEGGIGGLDLYKVTKLADNTWGDPENLGAPINTFKDEAFPFIHENGMLFFGSDGHPGFGGLDVFWVDLSKNEQLVNNLGNPINSEFDDFSIVFDKQFSRGYFATNRADAENTNDDIYLITMPEAAVEVIQKLVLNGTVIDAVTKQAIPLAEVILTAAGNPYISPTESSSPKGNFTFNNLLAPPTNTYKTIASKPGYHTTIRTTQQTPKNGAINIIIPMDPIIDPVAIQETKPVRPDIGNIFFDLDKYNLTLTAQDMLDSLVKIMNQYAEAYIQLTGHTDVRASNEYNQKLSENRVQSTSEFLIQKGVKADRILTQQAVGETNPSNRCADGVDCSDIEHALNRRVEIALVWKE